METVVVALRPKYSGIASSDFNPKLFDILLINVQVAGSTNILYQLPKTLLSYTDEPSDAIFKFLHLIAGPEYGGLRGKRAVFISPMKNETSHVKGTLYCVPVDRKDKLSMKYTDHAMHRPAFHCLETILDSLISNPLKYTEQAVVMIYRFKNWLKEKYNIPGAINLMFSAPIESRIKNFVINPAYFTEDKRKLDQNHNDAHEALAKMMSLNKCERTIINPVFGSGLLYKSTVDAFAVNPFWGLVEPNYSKVFAPRSSSIDSNWLENFPLHKAAFNGNVELVKECITKGFDTKVPDEVSWVPIHYAAWNGFAEVVEVLLKHVSPNIVTDYGLTGLHFASKNGHIEVVKLLLAHPNIDVNLMDKNNNTALNLAQGIGKSERNDIIELLRDAMNKPCPNIQIHLMDHSLRTLNLVSGANTTVQQLHAQMVQELGFHEKLASFFTIWIGSKSLELQLKNDHRPIDQLDKWKTHVIQTLTDQDPEFENPQLYWRRNAILSIKEERSVNNMIAIKLLFHEAKHYYIEGLYPCTEKDAAFLGALVFAMRYGISESRALKSLSNPKILATLIPISKFKMKNINWPREISKQYNLICKDFENQQHSPMILQLYFLRNCWNLTVYGSAFFSGYIKIRASKTPRTKIYIAVNDIGMHVIHAHTKMILQKFQYSDIEMDNIERSDPGILQITLKNAGETKEGGMFIETKQAGLIKHLMRNYYSISASLAS